MSTEPEQQRTCRFCGPFDGDPGEHLNSRSHQDNQREAVLQDEARRRQYDAEFFAAEAEQQREEAERAELARLREKYGDGT